MKSIIFLIFFSSLFNLFSCDPLANPSSFSGSDYPFSIKYGYNESAIFLNNDIQIFDVSKTSASPLNSVFGTIDCPSKEEKGGIYFKGFFYTSCLNSGNDHEFVIKVFDISTPSIATALKTFKPTSTTFYEYTTGTIRFFIKSSIEELIGVAWKKNNILNILEINYNSPEQKVPKTYTVSGMANDIDCLYINKHQRTVCIIGQYSSDLNKYQCSANIFKDTDSTSDFKQIYDCTDHITRKMRLSPDANENSENSDIFYYYFVDTNFDAYILPMRLLENKVQLKPVRTIYKVMSGCDPIQTSYDIAEDKFLGYNVFICVEKNYHKTIKIHLFKIEGDEIIFYRNSIDNPYIYDKDSSESELSMVNFVVLKKSLNFGFLSYRAYIDRKARYTIINQPTCNGNISSELFQFDFTIIDFSNYVYNDNYSGLELIIGPMPEGLSYTPNSNNKIKIVSEDYISGYSEELKFTFKVKNPYYESEECIATISIKGCFENCQKCSQPPPFSFTHQECDVCKDGYYKIVNYPSGYSKNCCKENVDCPDYFYFDGNEFKICDNSCLTCYGGADNECITCYNDIELGKYSSGDQSIIKSLKHRGPNGNYYYGDFQDNNKCIEEDTYEGYYLNQTTLTYKECFISCSSCKGDGNFLYHNCDNCKSTYYHYLNASSPNCYLLTEVEQNVFPDSDDGTVFYLKKCSPLCQKCNGLGKDQCTLCTTNSYNICNDDPPFECYLKDSSPGDSYYFDSDSVPNCFRPCDPSCKKCDKGAEEGISNCDDCADDSKFLYNKNCVSDCSHLHLYNLGKTCVSDCPIYTHKDTTNMNCLNCADQPTNKCIYLGTKYPSYNNNECQSCDIPKTFQSNKDYNILEDCYDLCESCSQRGTVERMNCDSCENNDHYRVEDTGNCIESDIEIDYYYKDDTTHEFKKCYETCKTCSGEGDILHNNCLTCEDNFQFDPINSGNCVELCQYYWYIDPSTSIFRCTEEPKCPDSLPYLTEINKGCVVQCSAASHNDERFFYRYKNTCITKCPENSMRDNILYACHSLDDVEDIFTYLRNYISQGTYAENLLIYSSDNKKYFHLFNTTNLGKKVYEISAINVGTSIIDLSNCISTLKQIYGYGNTEIFYIGVLDVERNDTSAPQFEYTIHNHLGTKLDINYCINNELKIEKSLNKSNNITLAKNIMQQYNYDIIDYNKDNPFFCDVCTLFDYDHLDSYDVLLNDRYDYYYDNQIYYFCEDNCNSYSTKIYLDKSRVECICSGKGNFSSYKKDKYQRYQKFSQNCKDSYMQYFKCAKNVFNKNLFKNNVGNFFLFFFILFQIGTVLLFYLFSKKPMMSHIHDVLIKRAKKGYEKESSEGSSNSSSYSRSGSYSESKSGGSRSGSESRSGSRSESKSGSRSESRSGSSRRSKSENESGSFSSKNSKANPPKNEKTKYAFVSIDNKEEKNNEDSFNLNINLEQEKNSENTNANKSQGNNETKEEEKNNISNANNKNAPNPMSQKYAKRYLSNRNDYIDNSYREDSYNFDLPKQKKKKQGEDGEEEEEEEEEENEEQNGNNTNEGNKNEDGINKPKNKNKKNEELPPAAIPAKTELERFNDEIKKFKKFSLMELYWFIIRKKHRIISLIYKKDIYDIFVIKFSLLILSYTIDFFITTFFFFESEIRKLFHEKKHVDPVYTIFMGLFCVLLSTALMRIVDYVMEYRMNFKKYEILQKYENDHSNYFNSLNRMIKGFNQKMIIYYIINFAFTLFSWYMVSAFIGTYNNTKLMWGIMVGINFALSNIFPFIYYFVAVLLQYKGIHKENFKLYKAGMIMLKI